MGLRIWPALVKQFFQRFFDKESVSTGAEMETNLFQTLGLLAAPGGFACIFMTFFYSGGWTLEAARYFFVSYSMIVIGLVVVFEWDMLFPDRRDYLILKPLPISMAAVFTAKVAALVLFVGLFLLDVNFFGFLFWVMLDEARDVVRLLTVHAAVILASGLFAVLAAATAQGVLIALLGPRWFRRLSALVQTVLMGLLVTAFFLTIPTAINLSAIVEANGPQLRWFPSLWFLGLYESLRPAVDQPALAALGPFALKALGCAAGLFVLSYAIGYCRQARRTLESVALSPSGPGRIRLWLGAVLNRAVLKHPVQRAAFYFITATITRSTRHRLFLASYAGFGVALAMMRHSDGRSSLVPLSLMLSFVLVSGLRAAFNFPSELTANWAFQMTENESRFEHLTAARKWIVICGILPLFALLAPVEFAFFPWTEALFHLAFGITLSVLLMQIMFAGFRKVPFTCSYFPGKVNLAGLSAVYAFGFTAYSLTMARFETWLFDRPTAAAAFFGAAGAACVALTRLREYGLSEARALDYDDAPDPAIRTLDLTLIHREVVDPGTK